MHPPPLLCIYYHLVISVVSNSIELHGVNPFILSGCRISKVVQHGLQEACRDQPHKWDNRADPARHRQPTPWPLQTRLRPRSQCRQFEGCQSIEGLQGRTGQGGQGGTAIGSRVGRVGVYDGEGKGGVTGGEGADVYEHGVDKLGLVRRRFGWDGGRAGEDRCEPPGAAGQATHCQFSLSYSRRRHCRLISIVACYNAGWFCHWPIM